MNLLDKITEVATSAVTKMKESASNLAGNSAAPALSPKTDTQEELTTGVTNKYGFYGLGQDHILLPVVQKMSAGDKKLHVKVYIPQGDRNDTGLNGALQFVDSLEKLFDESEVVILAASKEEVMKLIDSEELREAVRRIEGQTNSLVVFGPLDRLTSATIATEVLMAGNHQIDFMEVVPLSSDRLTGGKMPTLYCASGNVQVMNRIGDFLNAVSSRVIHVGTNLADAAKLLELYAAYETICSAALVDVVREAKHFDVNLKNFLRLLPQHRLTSVRNAVDLTDAYVDGNLDKMQAIQQNLRERLAAARKALPESTRTSDIDAKTPSVAEVSDNESKTTAPNGKILENGTDGDESHHKRSSSSEKADQQQQPEEAAGKQHLRSTNKSSNSGTTTTSTAVNSRAGSRTRRAGAAVVVDAAKVHIMGAVDEEKDDDDDDHVEDEEMLDVSNAGSSKKKTTAELEQNKKPNGVSGTIAAKGGDEAEQPVQKRRPGRPKRDDTSAPQGTRASTRTRSDKQQNDTETVAKRPVGRPKKTDAAAVSDNSGRVKSAAVNADDNVDTVKTPHATRNAEPVASASAEQQQPPHAPSNSDGVDPSLKFFKTTGGPAVTSTPTGGKFSHAFAKLNELKTSSTTPPGGASSSKTETTGPLSQPSKLEINDLPELDASSTSAAAGAKPQRPQKALADSTTPVGVSGAKRGVGRVGGAAAEKKKNAQIAQSAERIKSKKAGKMKSAAAAAADTDSEPKQQNESTTSSTSKRGRKRTAAGSGGEESDRDSKKAATTAGQSAKKASAKKVKKVPASKKRATTDDDDEDGDAEDADSTDDDDEEADGSEDTESEQRFTLDDANRETDANRAGWTELNEITTPTNIKFAKGDIVWSKITGYPWWPAQIVGLYQVSGKQTTAPPSYEVRVTWLGDNNWSDLKIDQIALYTEESKAKHQDSKKRKDKSYQLACMAADLIKKDNKMPVIEATEKAKAQYSAKSPPKSGVKSQSTGVGATTSGAESADDASGNKQQQQKKRVRGAAFVSAQRPVGSRVSLRRSVKDVAGGTAAVAAAATTAETEQNKTNDKTETVDTKVDSQASEAQTTAENSVGEKTASSEDADKKKASLEKPDAAPDADDTDGTALEIVEN